MVSAIPESPCCPKPFYQVSVQKDVWLIEEFQDYCLVHGHLLCVNGVILVILSLPKA